MRKRLRKKLHKGEFQELGFSFEAVIKENVDDNGFDAWMNELGKLLNQMGLNMIGSVYSGVCGGTITRQQGRVTLKEWELLSAWLREHAQIFDQVTVGKLEDLWPDRFSFYYKIFYFCQSLPGDRFSGYVFERKRRLEN